MNIIPLLGRIISEDNMKIRRSAALILAAIIVFCLFSACGEQAEPAPAPAAETPAANAPVAAPPVKSANGNDNAPVSTSEAPAEVNEAKALAESFIGKDVNELFSAVGEPNSAEYASSCLGPGEDGELVYDDFTVYTYRENGVETVQDVQ